MQMDLHQPAQDIAQKNLWKQITLFLLTIGAVGVCVLILYPFLPGLIGAIVLAVITKSPYNWLRRKIRSRNASAAVALIVVILSVVVPGFFVAQDLIQGTTAMVNFLRSDAPQQIFNSVLNSYPNFAAGFRLAFHDIDIQSAVRSNATYLGGLLAGLLGHSFGAITQLVIMLFILFFLFRDQERAIAFARSALLPFNDDETTVLLENIRLTIYATALGRLVIAVIQGTLAGLAFWILGVPNPMLWAVMTGVVAILPAVGPVLVWMPIVLYLGLTGHWGQATLLAVWGTFVVSSIDNFLYPVLVGSKLHQHTVTVLLAILGGIAVFGLSGVILGPIAFTVAATLIGFWRARNEPPISTVPQS
ncbi:MAG TPA: AI-2E family transporter [Edaphobacter sp.]